MKISNCKSVLLVLCGLIFLAPNVAEATDEAEVRGTVQRVFEQLKSRDYGSVYDALPASSRTRMSRSRFTNALSQAQNMYVLDRIEVGQVRVSANVAVADTVLYGRVVSPIETEGKIVVQQYLVREDGNWRVATGDSATIKKFLASNPAFGRKFPIRQPRVYVKQNGNWIEFNPPRSPRR
ncbi:MAG TPA: hypothetical protein VES69_11055 [Pyrinomonadaceae bacterium]|nr:hypothetical protein [Pyrinomonadaceae bacterium]